MYRILSLSGGGMRGVFQAHFLRRLAEASPRPLSEVFNLVAGTSTGSIIALAVALDIDLRRVCDLFDHHGVRIFRSRLLSKFRKGPRYTTEPLRAALTTVMGTTTLRQCRTDVVIPATILNRFAVRCITNLDAMDANLSTVEVALASCAAPTYFQPMKPAGQDLTCVDGGIWANTPSLVAAMETHKRKGISFNDMQIVTVGNGERPSGANLSDYSSLRPISPTMINYVLDMVFSTQSSLAAQHVATLLGPGRHMNINTQLPSPIELDNASLSVDILPGLAEEEARQRLPQLMEFLQVNGAASLSSDKENSSDSRTLSELSEEMEKAPMMSFFTKKKISSLATKMPREELLRRSRLLIVDDEKPDLIEDLRTAHFSVDWTPDINSTNMEVLDKQLYDLILLDFGNVGKQFGSDQGLSLLRHIKRVNPAIIVLTYTSRALGTKDAEFYRMADGTLAKDAGIADSLERIEDKLRDAHSLPNVWKSLLALCDIKAGTTEDEELQDLFVRGLNSPSKMQQLKSSIIKNLTSEQSRNLGLALLTKAMELGVRSYLSK